MCKVKTPAAPQMPPERQASRQPNMGAVQTDMEARTRDRMRASTPTILTSGSGATTMDETEKKTLLGQ